MIDPVGAAKAIREELKTRFPGLKFKVRADRFAGGNSVDVYCPEGFDREAAYDLRQELERYAYGKSPKSAYSDGLDMQVDATLPQAKFVSVNMFSEHIK